MNILILNGNPDCTNVEFDRYIAGYQLKLHIAGYYAKVFLLRDLKLHGLLDKPEPGQNDTIPFHSDDLRYIVNSLRDIDLLVWASPLSQGNISLLTRSVQQRIYRFFHENHTTADISLPYLRTYPLIPVMGAILQPEPSSTEHEILLNRLIQERMAADIQTVLGFLVTTGPGLTEALGETFRCFDYRLSAEASGDDLLNDTVSEQLAF